MSNQSKKSNAIMRRLLSQAHSATSALSRKLVQAELDTSLLNEQHRRLQQMVNFRVCTRREITYESLASDKSAAAREVRD